MYYFAPKASVFRKVEPGGSPWEATFHNDIGLGTRYHGMYCYKFLTLSNQTSRYIHKCIRMHNDIGLGFGNSVQWEG